MHLSLVPLSFWFFLQVSSPQRCAVKHKEKFLMIKVLAIVVGVGLVAANPSHAGTMYRDDRQCIGNHYHYLVSWRGPWSSTSRNIYSHVDQPAMPSTNVNDWDFWLGNVSANDCSTTYHMDGWYAGFVVTGGSEVLDTNRMRIIPTECDGGFGGD
jgi:hypothetical protein